MLRKYPIRFGIPCLILAGMLALTGNVWSQAPADSSRFHPMAMGLEFAAMDAKGDVLVDASTPARLSLDLKSTFRLGPNSNGINPLAEGLTGELEYAGAVHPCLMVSVAAGCFTQVGNGYRVRINDIFNCGLSIQLQNTPQSPNEILPYIELIPAVNKFDLRLTPGPNGKWDLKLNIDFLTSNPNVPIAGIIAILRSPTEVKIEAGDDFGQVPIDKVAFEGRVVK